MLPLRFRFLPGDFTKACFIGIIGFTALGLGAIAAFQWISALIARGWPAALGIVVDSWIDQRRNSHAGEGYANVVIYEYQVMTKPTDPTACFLAPKGSVRLAFSAISQPS